MTAAGNTARRTAPALLSLALLVGCGATPRGGPGLAEGGPNLPVTWVGAEATGPLAVTHGGVGSPPDWADDCLRAAGLALAALEQGGSPLDAAVLGTLILEDYPRFNAGTGANIRLDGRSIQMDAAVMTSEGRFGAVAVIERVRNPVAVARALLDTPHLLLAGEGATRFAHAAGFADELPTCPEAEAKYRQRIAELLAGQAGEGYATFNWRRYWNYPGPIPPELMAPAVGDSVSRADPGPHDTVGTVARGANGRFAATLSTGGTSLTLYGRVGDVPIYGAGCYAGPAGAVACTGFGEGIIRHAMARTVYDLLASEVPAREAVRRGCALFPADAALGLIAVDARGWGVAANRSMAYGQATTTASSRSAR
jgi:isoaspartyl peptidase/L-asparaginase-like protein (Ntn-hydrolase superfamily)